MGVFKSTLKWTARIVALVVLAVVVFVGTFLTFFIATPKFSIDQNKIRWAIHKFAPASVGLDFSSAEINVIRPSGMPFAKRLTVAFKDLCVRYEKDAVNACFSDISLAVTGGWGGKRLEGEGAYIPRLISIDPIRMLGGNVLVDIPKFPPSDPNQKPSSINVVDLLRKQILPKWQLDGSRIELEPLKILTAPNAGFLARFDLTTREEGDTLRARLREFHALGSPLKAVALIRLTRPQDWIGHAAPTDQPEAKRAWKMWLEGAVDLDKKREVTIKADSSIFDWQTLDFRLGTKWKGIAALREARIDGSLKQEQLDSRFSLKMGSSGAQVKALDFANCALKADLDKKVGGLKCGPQTVRLQLQERSLIRDPQFFLLQPEIDLRATRLAFGDTKEADFELAVNLVHHDFARLQTRMKGSVKKGPGTDPLHYKVAGDFSFAVDQLQRVVELFKRTPFEVPAPLNVLDGRLALTAKLNMNETGGDAQYLFTTRLDSRYQAVHLKLAGDTLIREVGGSLTPATRLDLAIESLKLSAPKFDLRVPPRFSPDSRFGVISAAANEDPPRIPKSKERSPMDLRVRIHTSQPAAIRIATNLTKAAIPIDLDLVYSEQAKKVESENVPPAPARGPASVARVAPKVGSTANARIAESASQTPTPLTGWVQIGTTPVELFRRNATVHQVRVDILPSGVQRLNGVVEVSYLDYDVNVLLLGTTAQPSVKLVSDPPLNDDHIIGLLLFGHAPDELDEDQKNSVSNARAAFANATLGVSSLYLLASTPIESVGYDPERDIVTAKVGLGGGASLELGGSSDNAAVGFRKKLSHDLVFRTDVESAGVTGQRLVSALVEWVKRF